MDNTSKPSQDPNNNKAKTGTVTDLGKDAKNKDESEYIAKPSKNGNPNDGKEMVQEVPPGKSIYLKGRCPLQQPAPGPCKGEVIITGITYTYKSK